MTSNIKEHFKGAWSILVLYVSEVNKLYSFDAKVVTNIASKMSSKESVTQRVGLETIAYDSLEHLSTTSNSSIALESTHHSDGIGTTIPYNMILDYHMEKPLYAQIYVDPLGRFAFNIDYHKIEFR